MVDSAGVREVCGGGAVASGIILRKDPDNTSSKVPQRAASGTAIKAKEPGRKLQRSGTGGADTVPAAAGAVDYSQPGALVPTFGYAGSLSKQPPFALFDIRDEVCMEVGGFMHGQVVRDRTGAEFVVVGVKLVEGTPRLWFHPRDHSRPGAGAFPDTTAAALRARLSPVGPFSRVARDLRKRQNPSGPFARVVKSSAAWQCCEAALEDFSVAEDSDEEELLLCRQCKLPIGEFAYLKDDEEGTLMHADCMAQLMRRNVRKQELHRQQEEAELKKSRRAEHDIGWKPEQVPCSLGHAAKLGYPAPTKGMFGLLLQRGSDSGMSARLVPTADPAESVNLEYLSLALQVRFKEGTEPRFSLDPVHASHLLQDHKASTQVKRFEPIWLEGTSVGDVLFQADYHLKELSMGEYAQPVIGMRSCFDLSEDARDKGYGGEWNGREWFVVKDASVQVSKNNVLMPQVQMGVEAREQIVCAQGLQDARITRPDHPLVKYAEAFTHNFDLIAERKSVIYHLRELAKASVLAKFVQEAEVSVDGALLNLGEAKRSCYPLEIPQLWNERYQPQTPVQDGKIMGSFGKNKHGVYGGVSFGIDVYRISSIYTGEYGLRGVDLTLDKFNLSAPALEDNTPKLAADGDPQRSEALCSSSSAFWSSISGNAESGLGEEDKTLLTSVFNPRLSDRRDEGDKFIAPEMRVSYVEHLRGLVREEEGVQQQRKEHFLSSKFVMGNAGSLFPSTWNSLTEVAQEQLPGMAFPRPPQAGQLHARPNFKTELHVFEGIVKSNAPVFDQCTEDGTRYRIYSLGSLQVRTTQEFDGEEAIGMVFSIRPPKPAPAEAGRGQGVQDHAKVVKVTEYVEKSVPGKGAPQAESKAGWRSHGRGYYVVFETEQGHAIVTEKLRDGTVAWREMPKDLDDRNSLAKVVRFEDCRKAGVTVGDMRSHRAEEEARRPGPDGATNSERKRFARGAYGRARGAAEKAGSGFRGPDRGMEWQIGAARGQGVKAKGGRPAKDFAKTTYSVSFKEQRTSERLSSEQWAEFRSVLGLLLGARREG